MDLSVTDTLLFRTIIVEADTSDVVFRIDLKTADDFTKWLKAYEGATHTHLNVRKTYPSLSKISFRKDFVCHHAKFMKEKGAVSELGDQCFVNRNGRSKNCQCPVYGSLESAWSTSY